MKALRATVLALAVHLACGAVLADQRDARLPELFAELRAAGDIATGRAIEQRIWTLWYEHDDAAVVLLMRQGHAAMARPDPLAALRSFDQVVRIAPDFGWNARATLYYLMGRHGDSLADIERTLALEPRHFGALSGRGLVYSALAKWQLALESFEAALAVHPQMTGPRLNAEAIRKEFGDREI
jgi:tetratricopeptide (TPR) repeat protein